MATVREPRLQVGSASWVEEERSASLQIVHEEVEEFSYSARNELEWLNEHMAGIFNENEINFAEVFKSPGKFQSKTPQTVRKPIPSESRMPLSDVFASTSNGPNPQPSTQTGRFKSPQLHTLSKPSPLGIRPGSPKKAPGSPQKPAECAQLTQDSGFHETQETDDTEAQHVSQPEESQPAMDPAVSTTSSPLRLSPVRHLTKESPERTTQAAKEEETHVLVKEAVTATWQDGDVKEELLEEVDDEEKEVEDYVESYTPTQSPPQKARDDANSDDVRFSSEASSPVRPLGRKSSLNFASLPAREPLTAGKSLGGRLSRTGHLDNSNVRSSYYQRATGGKSLGNLTKRDSLSQEQDAMDVDATPDAEGGEAEKGSLNHTKTYTQRLQDQISMLGKPQSIATQAKAAAAVSSILHNVAASELNTTPNPFQKDPATSTPHDFPDDEDEDDDWIGPPKPAEETMGSGSVLSKSLTADIMEGIHSTDTIGQSDFHLPKSQAQGPTMSPQRAPIIGKGFHSLLGHGKSGSIATLPTNSLFGEESLALVKTVSNSDVTLSEVNMLDTPSKSPPRSLRDSPLKQVKNKLSSILKSSRGLLASSAAISAEGRSMLSPSASRLALHLGPSTESVVAKPQHAPRGSEASCIEEKASPTKPISRRTRASTEREKEEKRREKEAKVIADQMDKLDKIREEEREKARLFSKEQEQVAAMEKKVVSRSEQDRSLARETTANAVRGSPEKSRAAEEPELKQADGDAEMTDGGQVVSSRSTGLNQPTRIKDSKRPVKPTKETTAKMKQAPTVIRVNMGSQTSQYHPGGNRVSTASHDSLGLSGSQVPIKVNKPTLQTKTSSQSLKALPAVSRPKAVEMSVKKKEQEEREAQRRRDVKAEMDKKRALAQEEQRKQAERQRHAEAEEKKNAQRQAVIDKAKHSRAPPPAVRSQTGGLPDGMLGQQRAETTRPPSRMTSGMPISTVLSSAVKTGAKRALMADASDEGQGKRPPSRGGPSYQVKDAKRRRTSEAFDDSDMGHTRNIKGPPVRPSNGFKKVIRTGKNHVSQTATNKTQDMPPKSVFQNGYTNAPHSATRDLFKATVTAQHNSHIKAAHPLDMAQISKGPIPFAPSLKGGAGGSSFKTPGRLGSFATAAKSTVKKATRSSPRFQNGESIELPEIQTDDEDEDDDDAQAALVAAWADSPDLRRALIRQETMDPSQIFGQPAPLNMEEVFNKSKDKWHKFRQRTSSANWSGLDRLTEDDIRKDMVARDKMRRDGGWSYEMSKDML